MWSNANISSLHSENISRKKRKHKSLRDPGEHIYSGREVFTLRLLRLSRDVPDCYHSLFGPSGRKSERSSFPPFPGRKRPQDRTDAHTGPRYIGRLWDPTGPFERRNAAPVKSGIAFQRYAESGPGQSKPRRLRRGRGVTPAGRY